MEGGLGKEQSYHPCSIWCVTQFVRHQMKMKVKWKSLRHRLRHRLVSSSCPSPITCLLSHKTSLHHHDQLSNVGTVSFSFLRRTAHLCWCCPWQVRKRKSSDPWGQDSRSGREQGKQYKRQASPDDSPIAAPDHCFMERPDGYPRAAFTHPCLWWHGDYRLGTHIFLLCASYPAQDLENSSLEVMQCAWRLLKYF